MNNRRRHLSKTVIALLMVGLVIGAVPTCYATDVTIISPTKPLPPIFSDFNITPTDIQLGDYVIIININNQSITWMSTTHIGVFFTQIIEIKLERHESKIISYRIIPYLEVAFGIPGYRFVAVYNRFHNYSITVPVLRNSLPFFASFKR